MCDSCQCCSPGAGYATVYHADGKHETVCVHTVQNCDGCDTPTIKSALVDIGGDKLCKECQDRSYRRCRSCKEWFCTSKEGDADGYYPMDDWTAICVECYRTGNY